MTKQLFSLMEKFNFLMLSIVLLIMAYFTWFTETKPDKVEITILFCLLFAFSWLSSYFRQRKKQFENTMSITHT